MFGFVCLPHYRRLVFSSVLARVGAGGMPLALMLIGYRLSGSWSTAAAVGAAYALGCLGAPLMGRLVDRSSRRLRWMAWASVPVSGCVLLAGTPAALVASTVALAALIPPIGPYMRLYWHDRIDDRVATAWEDLVGKTGYVVMPAVAGLVAAASSPGVYVIAHLLCLVIGCSMMPLEAVGARRRYGRADASACGICLGLGVLTGLIELRAPQLAEEIGLASIAGGLLMVLAVGGIAGSWSFARFDRTPPLWVLVPVAVAAAMLLWTPIAPIGILLVGFCGALASATVTSRTVQRFGSTESLGWLLMSTVAGIGLGQLLTSQHAGWGMGFAGGTTALSLLAMRVRRPVRLAVPASSTPS